MPLSSKPTVFTFTFTYKRRWNELGNGDKKCMNTALISNTKYVFGAMCLKNVKLIF